MNGFRTSPCLDANVDILDTHVGKEQEANVVDLRAVKVKSDLFALLPTYIHTYTC